MVNFVFLWVFGLPIIYYTAVVLDQGLGAAWFWMNIQYLCMNITLTGLFLWTDWHLIREKILLDSSDDEKQCIESKDKNNKRHGETTTANESTPFL